MEQFVPIAVRKSGRLEVQLPTRGGFSCITGEIDSAGDFEIDEVCWS